MIEHRQPRSRWAAGAALAAGLLVLLTPLNERWSQPLIDAQLRLLAPAVAPAGVLVVDIDDASLAALQPQFGPWPYKRDVYALTVESLRALGARAVAFDLLLVDTQPGDAALARVLARRGAPVVLAAAGLRHVSDAGGTAGKVPGHSPASPTGPAHTWPTIALPTASVWPAPQQPPVIGIITTPVDADGVLRRLPLWHEAEGRRWPVLPQAVHNVLSPQAASTPMPLDASGALHLAFAPASAALPVLPLGRLLLREPRDARDARDGAPAADEALRQRVQGQVVFIGSSALLGDTVLTVQGQVSGTQVLAQAYAALRDGQWIHPPAAWANATLLAVTLLPAVFAVRRRRVQLRRDIAAHGLALLAAGALAAWWLLQLRMPTLWVAPLVALAAGLGTAALLRAREQAAAQQRLAQALAVAAETARTKGEFLANVSHEIRTPLNAVMGVAELLAQTELNPTQRHQVQLFQEAGRTLHALINDLLDLSKIEANRLELDMAPFALHALLQRMVTLLQPQAQRKGLALRLELVAGLPDGVHGDSLRLERALINLVSNAVKFTARGEVLLRARLDDCLPNGVCFDVFDSGIGIAPSKLESIFEPFSQADSSVTRVYGGTGLGLAITRSVARLLGGTVDVQSTPGQGSHFTLRLPLPAAEPPPASKAEPPPSGPGELPPASAAALQPAVSAADDRTLPLAANALAPLRRSVLLAEDNEVNAYIFTAMLADQNLDIDVAPNGLAALEMLRLRPYDIAFIDVQMPGLDGLSLTRQWRAHECETGQPPLPMVSLTANAFASDVKASLDAGSSQHVAKPFSRLQLIETLDRLAPAARGATVSAPHAEPDTRFDPGAARQRLGTEAATYQRVCEHAVVFLEAWPAAFARVQADAADAVNRARALSLADDLLQVATRLGALELVDQAALLGAALAQADDTAIQAAQLGVQRCLSPVLMALLHEE